MPGRRYGGFMMGDKYVRVSRRHQAANIPIGLAGKVFITIVALCLFGIVAWMYLRIY